MNPLRFARAGRWLLLVATLASATPLQLSQRETPCIATGSCLGSQDLNPGAGPAPKPGPKPRPETSSSAPPAPSPPPGPASSQSRPPPPASVSINSVNAASSISSYMSSPSFVPYAKPDQKVEEWIALGDSYTAGTGCNGRPELIAADAARGQRAYPMQMSNDHDNWAFVNNGDQTLPRFTFSAYTGDKVEDLLTNQLKPGPFYPTNKDLPRHAFGSPQLAVMTIGGNDARLSDILNDCIYRAWFPSDCQQTLNDVNNKVDGIGFEDSIQLAMFNTIQFGRAQGGASPAQGFQLYVSSYIPFFDETNPQCNDIAWGYWSSTQPKMTTDLRRQLNALTVKVNNVIKKAATDLERLGVIYVDGFAEQYTQGHQYCAPGHTNQQMIDYDTWFWSPYEHSQSSSEGPGGPGSLGPSSVIDINQTSQAILDFVYPGKNLNANSFNSSHPPWEGSQYKSVDALMSAMRNDNNATINAVPFQYLRTFHPKGTAYGKHAEAFFSAIADNRGAASNVTPAKPGPHPGGNH